MGHITVSGVAREKYFELQVKDDGIGISPERLQQVQDGIRDKVLTGKDFYGLYNVNERIRLSFGEEYGMDIMSQPGQGTMVSIRLPYVESE